MEEHCNEKYHFFYFTQILKYYLWSFLEALTYKKTLAIQMFSL